MAVTFINLYSTKEQALSTRYSPNTLFYNYKGIQLLPDNDLPYVQTTDNPNGVELEDWEVFAVSLCGIFRTDITDKFFIEKVFSDNSGTPQISWSLTNVPDLGSGLIYLEVNQLLEPSGYGDTWYSNVFQITEDEKGYTSRIDYRDDVLDIMNSVQVMVYWWHDKVKREISSYTETSTQKTKTVTSLATQFERWTCRRMPNDLILKIESLFDLAYMYINGFRCYPFEISEIPDLQAQENDLQKEYLLSVDYSDSFDPLVEPVDPEPPEPPTKEIRIQGFRDGALYYAVFSFDVTPAEDVQLGDPSVFVNWNGAAGGFQGVVYADGATISIDTPKRLNNITPGEINIFGFSIRIADGINQFNYRNPDDNEISFTAAEIAAETIKTAIVNII